MTYQARLLLLAVLGGFAVSCGGDELTLPNEGQPAELRVIRGDEQNGTVGQALADSLVVQVRDRFGTAVAGVEVSWTAEFGGSVDPETSVTDANGRAGTQRVLGPQPGIYTTVAMVSTLPDAPVVFRTTGVAAKLSIVTQPSPSGVSGVVLERQPVIQLLDADAKPVARAGVVVTAQIAGGGGELDGVTSVPSDDAGVVTFTDLAIRGSPGIRTLIFAADAFASVASAPIAVGVGAPATIAAVAGDGQSATVNTALPTAPAVVIKDGDGNPVPGIPVTFAVASGGGSVAGATATTGADGIATVGGWTLGTTAGGNTLTASVEGLELAGSPVTFTAVGVAGPLSPDQSTISVAPGTIAASAGGVTSTITVTAKDAFGNPLPDLPVALSANGGGNMLTQPQPPQTNASGVATGRLAATAAGPHVVSAAISGQTLPATATVTVTAAGPNAGRSSASVGNGTAGQTTTVSVELKDAFDNPVSGAASRIAIAVSGANTTAGGPAQGQGGGSYTVNYTPHVAGTDVIAVSVDGVPVSNSPISSTVVAGPASPATTTAQLPTAASVFSPVPVLVTVRDADGNLRTAGGDEVRIRTTGVEDIVATHNGDGTYSASFSPPGLGTISVEVLLNGNPIAGSPFSVTITLF